MIKTKKFNAIIALQIILTMTLYYFVLIGFTAITYAIDLIETNNHNVDFSAYFINENGEKTDTVQSEITSEQYLYIDVSVKNEGFFKGTIKINSNNFRIKNDILSSNVSEILNNEILLNQINAGTTETIKVAITSLEQNNISISKFNSKTDVELSGEYYYSNNIENNRNRGSRISHMDLIKYFQNLEKTNEIGDKLNALRKNRNDADYELYFDIGKVKESKMISKEILNFFNKDN